MCSSSVARVDPRTVVPRQGDSVVSPVSASSIYTQGSLEVQAPSTGSDGHHRMEESSASPDALDDADSVLGDESEVASLLSQISEGGLDTDSKLVCDWDESLAGISPSLPSLTVHVDHMTVVVQQDDMVYRETPIHPQGVSSESFRHF